jgi:hypothetical protein
MTALQQAIADLRTAHAVIIEKERFPGTLFVQFTSRRGGSSITTVASSVTHAHVSDLNENEILVIIEGTRARVIDRMTPSL